MTSVRPIAWSPDLVQRFWDYWATREDAQDSYFARQNGEAVICFLEQALPLGGLEILDYGAGPGYLVDRLLARGAHVSAVDFSQASIEQLNSKFRYVPGWRGARIFENHRLPWESDTFDAVCCLETIEHVLDEHTDLVFQELQRVLRPDGLALFTTPHDEDLVRSQVYCPHCSCEFHRWQHVRAWTARQLDERLAQYGFEVLFCQGINLDRFRPDGIAWRQISFADAERWAKRTVYRLLDRFLPRPFPYGRAFQVQRTGRYRPHLVAVVRKPRQMGGAGIEPRRRLHPSQAA